MRKQVSLAVALAAALVVAAVAWAAASAVVAAGSGGSWPSTYFNGPLGNNEILPAVKGHTLLSLWSGADGCNVSCARALIQRRITDIGHAPPLIGYQCDDVMTVGSCGLDNGPNDLSENYVHSLGAIPLITWNAGDRDYAGVAAGNYDSDIDTAAARLKAFGHRVMIRLYHELEEHAPWNTTDFINAWRYVVNRFRADGATNVGFWWCPGELAGGALRTQINQSYPGDQYVDWVGSDGYNWDTNTAYNATGPGWNEFSWTFNYQISGSPSMEQQWGPEKPFVVGETGTKYDTAGVPSGHTVDPNRKADWYRNIPSAAASMPYLIGVQFFDVNAVDTPPDDWQVDSTCDSAGNNCPTPPTPGAIDSNTYSGFLSMADSSQFSGGVAGGGGGDSRGGGAGSGGGKGSNPPGQSHRSGRPRIESASNTGLARGAPTITFKLVAGSHAPKLRSFAIALPRGLRFVAHRVHGRLSVTGVSVDSARVSSQALRRGRLVVTLRRPAGSAKVRIGARALKESVSLRRGARLHHLKRLTLRVVVTDAAGHRTALARRLKIT